MITYADWLSAAGALWYSGQSLLLLALAYFLGCIFGCWFRRIQPQPVEAMVTAPSVAPDCYSRAATRARYAAHARAGPIRAAAQRLRGGECAGAAPRPAHARARA